MVQLEYGMSYVVFQRLEQNLIFVDKTSSTTCQNNERGTSSINDKVIGFLATGAAKPMKTSCMLSVDQHRIATPDPSVQGFPDAKAE